MTIDEKLEQIEKEFKDVFESTTKLLENQYPRSTKGNYDKELSEKTSRLTIGVILLNTMKQVQADAYNMIATDFAYKYVPNLPVLDFYDFPKSKIMEIINESNLSDRDKQIAIKMFTENKTQAEIYDEMLDIKDKKTISNNAPDISKTLKHIAVLVNARDHRN